MSPSLDAALGRREQDLQHIRATVAHPWFGASTLLLVVASALLVASLFFPYWRMDLQAPQYPRGLDLVIYVDHMRGDITEIDNLNHYIGMAKISEAAPVTRQVAPLALVAVVLLVLGTAFIHRRWFAPLALPAILFPFAFVLILYAWLRAYGQNLDPHAAFSSSITPFVPTILGRGEIAQFTTDASLLAGWWMAFVAAMMIGAGLALREGARRAATARLAADAAGAATSALEPSL